MRKECQAIAFALLYCLHDLVGVSFVVGVILNSSSSPLVCNHFLECLLAAVNPLPNRVS